MKDLFLRIVFLLLAMHSANSSEVGDILVMVDDGKLVVAATNDQIRPLRMNSSILLR